MSGSLFSSGPMASQLADDKLAFVCMWNIIPDWDIYFLSSANQAVRRYYGSIWQMVDTYMQSFIINMSNVILLF